MNGSRIKIFPLCVITLLICFFSKQVRAQRYPFYNLGVENGLIQSQATCLAQDAFGNLWIGTLGGLSKYDGKSFTNYTIRNGLPNNVIRAIAADKHEHLWVGTNSAVSEFDGKTFRNYLFDPGEAGMQNNTQQIKILNDTVWSIAYGKIYYIAGQKMNKLKLPDEDVAATALLPDGENIWVAATGILYHYHGHSWGSLSFVSPANKQPYVSKIFKDKEGRIWLTTNAGLYRVENGKIVLHSANGHALDVLPTIYDITEDNSGALWLGMASGAARITADGIMYYNKRNGLSDNQFDALITDAEGNVWLASDGQGVFRFSGTRFTALDESMGLPSAQIMAIASDRRGGLYLGTFDAGIYNFKDGEVKSVDFPVHPLPAITSLCQSHDSRLWIGTRSAGLWEYTNTFKSFQAPEHHFPSNFVTSLYEDTAKRLWIGFVNGAVLHERDTFKQLPVNADVMAFITIGTDSVLLATGKGLMLYAAGTISAFKTHGLIDSSSIECATLQGHELWIGTSDNGALYYDLETQKTFAVNKSNGLQSDFIYNIITDNAGNIWVGTGYGIHKITTAGDSVSSVTFYGKGQGITGMESNQNSVFKMPDGSIWFGTTNGAIHYQPNSTVVASQPVNIVLQSVKLFGENITDTTYFDSSDNWYGVPYDLRLPYRKNNISFTFQGISLSGGQQLLYCYKIDGLDAPWSAWSATNSVTYSALPPGKYIFRVQCMVGGKAQELSYPFEIIAPFQKTRWFQLVVFIACIFIGITFQYIINTAKQRREKLLAKLRSEEQAKIRMRTAEDFHDEVGNKITRINVLNNVLKTKVGKVPPDVSRIFDQIEENTNLLYSGTKDILWSLQPANDSLYEIIHRVRDFGTDLFQDTNIEFEFTGTNNDWRQYRLPLDVSRNLIMIFKEALNNCLKYSKASVVKLHAELRKKDILHITLSDNGSGFDMDHIKLGHGINNMNVRATRIHARLYIDAKPGKGTHISFTFKIPSKRG